MKFNCKIIIANLKGAIDGICFKIHDCPCARIVFGIFDTAGKAVHFTQFQSCLVLLSPKA